jgi:hypothetical protein
MNIDWRMTTGKRSGYLSVLCRAVDEPLPESDDEWMGDSVVRSWEYEWLVDRERADAQPLSRIKAKRSTAPARPDLGTTRWERLTGGAPRTIDLTAAIEASPPVVEPDGATHTLSLRDSA